MKIFSIDTSSNVASIALMEDGELVDEMHILSEQEHSQTLMPMIEEMFERNNISVDDINLISCSRGPRFFYRN